MIQVHWPATGLRKKRLFSLKPSSFAAAVTAWIVSHDFVGYTGGNIVVEGLFVVSGSTADLEVLALMVFGYIDDAHFEYRQASRAAYFILRRGLRLQDI